MSSLSSGRNNEIVLSLMFVHRSIYKDLHAPAIIAAGVSVSIALLLSLLLTFQHLRYYTNPQEQKWIVAVIFMVPMYSTESILSLWNADLSFACDILRNCYEAFALYAFGSYCWVLLGNIRFLDRYIPIDRQRVGSNLINKAE